MADYAVRADLETFWRPLSDEEGARADDLLHKASVRLRAEIPTLDQRIADEKVDPELAEQAVCMMVMDLMARPVDAVGTSQLQVAGPFTNQQSFGAPGAKLRLPQDQDLMKLLRGRGKQRAFGVPGSPDPVTS